MDEAETDSEAVARLRATAHPVRLRILSLLTAEAMSAAEVARALEITHANASYHLRLLHDIGELVVESEEKIRGGVAKRYRYDATRELASTAPAGSTTGSPMPGPMPPRSSAGSSTRRRGRAPRATWRRGSRSRPGTAPSTSSTRPPTSCTTRPGRPGLPSTIHVSFTSNAFTMSGGLTGEAVRWTPTKETTR